MGSLPHFLTHSARKARFAHQNSATTAFLKVNCRFQVYTTQDTTALIRAFLRQDATTLIRAFLRVNRRFQVYTTQDTTALVRVFLQVKGVFRHTTGLINVFLYVNCNFQVYTTRQVRKLNNYISSIRC